ncbi:Peripheral-type benzodiazepine receptor-associated protein [Echinococcus granulosus]|uniref:Peripheral-type benzodiazepine receptor-associated protein n=1 Tax=Echinococcus granulosus TaxID=6210 RepID=W6UP39_ECHGR|nr:Peripheral-type benzodiazepine receptor-associated protein [Echinococcus granulosus]EUB62998.1 Peripheral-type benzodiazepine receptor-associated protein [Echinococcus granulosus]
MGECYNLCAVKEPYQVSAFIGPAVAELKEAIENLKVREFSQTRLRDSERRCALETLRYEELLLELESSRMRQKYESLEVVGGVHSSASATSTTLPNGLEYVISRKGTTSTDTTSFKHSCPVRSKLLEFAEDRQNHDWYPSKVGNFQVDGEWNLPKRVPAPRGIALEKQLTHSAIVSWKPPGFLQNEEEEVTAYHVYADGQFRNSVGGHEKCRALVENIDSSKQHRISIRTVTGRGQSKDAECTLLVGKGASAAPSRLKASHITTNSAKLSWLPGSSNFYHAVILNDHELRVCPPGVYKLFLTGLPPNTLHRVRVEARRTSGSSEPPLNTQCLQGNPSSDDHKRNSDTIEFQTAPIGLPDPPKNVQVEAGPQDGVLLVSWRPVPQATHVLPNCKNEPLVQGYTVCINDKPLIDVPGVDCDHVLLPLRQLATLLKSPEFTLATRGARQLQRQRQHPPPLFLPQSHHSRNVTTTEEDASEADSSQSTGDSLSDLRNEEEEEEARSDPSPEELWLTVYSTLSANTALSMNKNGTAGEKKGSSGPASPPIKLIPNLLLLAAGSLESAVELFGKRLSKRLGLNENNAVAACVSLRRPNPVCISIEKPGMDAERSDNADSAEDDQGIVHIHAGNIPGIAKTSSPTSDALDSAEALLRERQLQKHKYSDSNQYQQHPSQYCRETLSTGNRPSSHHARHPREDMFQAHGHHNYRNRYDMEPPDAALETVHPRYYPRRSRSGRHLRATRSMSDENDCFQGREKLIRLPCSTESTESERRQNSLYQPFFSSTKSTLDLRAEKSHRRGCHVCQWHRSSPLRQYTNSRVSLMRRSKSLGRSHNLTLMSSSSNDEGISKAYFQRLQEREQSKNQFSGVGDVTGQRFSRRWRQCKVPLSAMDCSPNWNQKELCRSDKLRVGKSSFAKSAPKRWLQKITSVPEIHLSRGHADSDDHLRRCMHSSERQLFTNSPHCQHRFSGTMGDRQRRERSWREEEDEGCLGDDNAAVMSYRFDDPDDGPYDWSEGPVYPPSSQNRPKGHSDLISRNSKTMVTSGRRTVSSGLEGDYRLRGVGHKNPKRGPGRRFQLEVRNQTPDRRPLSSPSPRPTGAGDDCGFFVSLYDYDPATMSPNPGAVDDELPFREGDIIKVYGDRDEDGFYFGECNGRKGFVPSNMVCEASADEVTDFLRRRGGHHGRNCTTTSTGLPPGQMTKPHRTAAQHTGPSERSAGHHRRHGQFHAISMATEQFSKVHIVINGVATVIKRVPTFMNWSLYAQVVWILSAPKTEEINGSRLQDRCLSMTRMEQNFAYYHYPQHSERAGRGRPIREKSRRTRLQRSACAEEKQITGGGAETVGRKRGESQKPLHCIMEALYDYDPHIYSPNVDVETELKFRAGDRIRILSEMDDDGFYVGRLESSGRCGLVPSNFLRELPRVAAEGNTSLINSGASDGGDVYDSRPKMVYGVSGSRPTHGSKPSHTRGANGNRSMLRSSDDLGPVSRRRRSSGRTREKMSKQLSRGRVKADNLEDAEEEEDSMITSTVPPPNPSNWPDSPEVSVKLHSVVPLSTTAAATTTVTPTPEPPTLIDPDVNRNLVSSGGDAELSKDSPDSDGQGGVIYMDINSKKHSKYWRCGEERPMLIELALPVSVAAVVDV